MKKMILISALSLVLIVTLSACGQTDVVGEMAKTSFGDVLEAIPNQIEADEINGGWSLSAPDGSARFIWSKDYSKSTMHDVMIEFDGQPFLNAGLDVNKLPQGIAIEDKIILGTELGEDQFDYAEEATPSTSFNLLVDRYRDSVGYHEVLDHYGVDLGDGNKFEWAKDMNINDKDIVFIVDPKIFIEAGVTPDEVEGWVYASVEIMDESGRPIEVKKFLKPFDIR